MHSVLSAHKATQCALPLLSSDSVARLDMSRPFCSQARLHNARAFLQPRKDMEALAVMEKVVWTRRQKQVKTH